MIRIFLAEMALLTLLAPNLFADVTLVDQGHAKAAIFAEARIVEAEGDAKAGYAKQVDEQSQRMRLRDSVRDLAHYLEKMSGAKIEIVAGAPPEGDSRLPILIGKLAEDKFGPPQKQAPLKQGLRVVVTPGAIGLFGESDLAASYAVYELLDRLGCRWFMPSEMGEVIPERKTITLAEGDDSSAPYTIYRGLWYADDDYLRRNRVGGLLLNAGHGLEGYITPEQRKEHPEWVGTVDGKPQPRRLRWSAPGLADAIAAAIIAQHEKNPDTLSYSLSGDDGLGYDNSPEDRALDADDFDPSLQDISITDRQVWLCNQIVEKVAQKYPDLLFGMLAYGASTRPPVREKVHPNLIPQVAPITYTRAHPMTDDGEPNNKEMRYLVEGWGKAASRISYYFYGFYLAEPAAPNPFITKWGVNVPIVFDNNCKFWQPETITNFETAMHAHYLGLRLAWDPEQDPQTIFDELHEKFYGGAAKETAAYWRFIDGVWVETPEYSGCGFGHLRRFTPERMSQARSLMNAALSAAGTPEEKFRVTMADDSLQLFEQFVRTRRDYIEGRFAGLDQEAKTYRDLSIAMADKYEPQYAFGRMGWTRGDTLYGRYFGAFYQKTYDDAARVAKEFTVLTQPPLREWKYRADEKKEGEAAGWAAADFNDSGWKTTDTGIETWSSLGYHNYMGSMWYRKTAALPDVPAGKKIYLWIGSTDGSVKVFVNGQHVPYTNEKGETADDFGGYCQPASFDITAAAKPGQENEIALFCTRTFINELGTGGLLGPPAIYRQKD